MTATRFLNFRLAMMFQSSKKRNNINWGCLRVFLSSGFRIEPHIMWPTKNFQTSNITKSNDLSITIPTNWEVNWNAVMSTVLDNHWRMVKRVGSKIVSSCDSESFSFLDVNEKWNSSPQETSAFLLVRVWLVIMNLKKKLTWMTFDWQTDSKRKESEKILLLL